MSYEVEIIADSIAESGKRLTTMQVTYPRFVHSELMTHRQFSRNAASSRAIPIERILQQVKEDPAGPVWWGKNQSGMQAKEELTGVMLGVAQARWLQARDEAVHQVVLLAGTGLHKQIVNRILEPWMWMTVVVSATEWGNFFGLRCHPDAQPEIQKAAYMMRDAYATSVPENRAVGEYHLPYIEESERSELSTDTLVKVSVARCARVSYLRQGEVREIDKDIELHDRLCSSGHWSPFEHIASASEFSDARFGNFTGWHQYRKEFLNECR
jgi:thymidylate synthase ThyX